MTKCGLMLGHCVCASPVMRSPAEIDSAHRQAVARAKARGWATPAERRHAVRLLWPDAWAAYQNAA